MNKYEIIDLPEIAIIGKEGLLLSGRLNDAPSVTLNDAISTYPQACVAV